MTIKEYIQKYGEFKIQTEGMTIYSNGKNSIGGFIDRGTTKWKPKQ
jgi:hypothetical protein